MDTTALIDMFAQAGPIGVFGIAIIEKLLPIVPSTIVFVLLGMMAASSLGDLAMTVVATASGSTIGALWWYGIGLALGRQRCEAVVLRFGRYVLLKPSLYRRMSAAYARNHFWVTAIGQTIPAVRVYLAIPAGVLNLAMMKFLAATMLGSLAWSAPLLTVGYILRDEGAESAEAGLLVVKILVGFELLVLLSWRTIRRIQNHPSWKRRKERALACDGRARRDSNS